MEWRDDGIRRIVVGCRGEDHGVEKRPQEKLYSDLLDPAEPSVRGDAERHQRSGTQNERADFEEDFGKRHGESEPWVGERSEGSSRLYQAPAAIP